jgi:hypothetical protein
VSVLIAALVSILPATIAHADCPEGLRLLKESEQQAYLSIQQAIKAGIPPAPAAEF